MGPVAARCICLYSVSLIIVEIGLLIEVVYAKEVVD